MAKPLIDGPSGHLKWTTGANSNLIIRVHPPLDPAHANVAVVDENGTPWIVDNPHLKYRAPLLRVPVTAPVHPAGAGMIIRAADDVGQITVTVTNTMTVPPEVSDPTPVIVYFA
jgi:hypothetical protein